MINSVTLTGRLTKEVDVRFTQNGTAVASGSLAVNRRFKQEGQPEADFFNIVVWGKQAEVLADHTTKGSLIGVEGRLQTRSYENAEGNRIYVTEVVVENFAFLETKKEDAAPAPQSKPQYKNGGKSYQKR